MAANLAALGAAVSLIALVGEDEAGSRLGSLMDDAGVAFDRVADPGYATIEKIRCVARHHQMLRADFEMAPPPAMRAGLAERFARALRVHDLVVLSDIDDAGVTHERAHRREVHDVTGAGDTVIATLAWRMAEGDNAVQAMRWANVAAYLAVQTFGTAVLTHDELVEAFDATR